MEKDGTYIVVGVMVVEENGTYGAAGMVWCHLIFFSRCVRWVMCFSRN